MLAKSKLNGIEALVSRALIDMDISHRNKKIWDWIVLIQKSNEFVIDLCGWWF